MQRLHHKRFFLFLAAFAASGLLLGYLLPPEQAVLVAFDFAAMLFIASLLRMANGAEAEHMRRSAEENDAGRGLLLAVGALISGVMLVAVAVEMGKTGSARAAYHLPLAVGTIVLAWAFGNALFMLHYAHLYYDKAKSGKGDRGGLEFPECQEPTYTDFAYFAFNLGMTYQVSDVPVTDRNLRVVVIIHCLIAFFFNIGVLALAFNLVANAIQS